MTYCKKVGANLSQAYLGYIDKETDVTNIEDSNDVRDSDHIFMVCDMPAHQFYKVAFHNFRPSCFDFFRPNEKCNWPDGKLFWEMGSATGLVHFVEDSFDDNVYILHCRLSLVYLLGKMHKDCEITKACKWRFSRLKI